MSLQSIVPIMTEVQSLSSPCPSLRSTFPILHKAFFLLRTNFDSFKPSQRRTTLLRYSPKARFCKIRRFIWVQALD